MEIKLQCKNYVLSFSFGYKTDWWDSFYFFCIQRLYYEKREVNYAELVYTAFPKRRIRK